MTDDPSAPDPLAALAECRAAIEEVDRQIVALIAQRTAIGRQAATLKRAAGLPIVDREREAAVCDRAARTARALDLDGGPVREIFERVVAIARRAQLDAD